MKSITNKVIVAAITLILITTTNIIISDNQNIVIADSNNESVIISCNEIDDQIIVDMALNNFERQTILIDGTEYTKIIIEDESNKLQTGNPDIADIRRSIIIPDDQKMSVNIISSSYTQYNNVLIAPSKGNLKRNIDPNTVPYTFSDIYNQDEYFPGSLAELESPYIVRDYRGQVVIINPIQYNPVSKILRVYNEISLEITPTGFDTVNVYDRIKSLRLNNDFIDIYNNNFINFKTTRYTPVEEYGEMLIIAYDSFYNSMLPFVEWKIMKGIPTTMVNMSDVGTTANDVDTYIENFFNTHNLTFVLLVGDITEIPSLDANGGKSDPSYSYILGDDHYPDLFIGRFSAENTDEVDTQVNRTITYEKYPQASAEWYHKGTGIASDDGSGSGDDSEWDWEHLRNIRADLLNFNYTLIDEFYEGSQGGEDASGNPSAGMVTTAVNDGRGIINYCGHGSRTSWGTSGFSNSNVNSLVNNEMLPFIWSVACVNGEFDIGTCFAEAWLRATNNNIPTGAIAFFGSSVNQAWNPPMDAQDEFNAILVGTYTDNKKYTFGGLSANGCMHMNDNYGTAGYDETDNWHLFGDPSVVWVWFI
jgi:hypothetical protein